MAVCINIHLVVSTVGRTSTEYALESKGITNSCQRTIVIKVEFLNGYVENACQFTYDYGDMWEQYYTSVENNFEKTMAFIAKNNMLEQFKTRLKQCVEWASPCGWGFADTIADIYYEHFPDDD